MRKNQQLRYKGYRWIQKILQSTVVVNTIRIIVFCCISSVILQSFREMAGYQITLYAITFLSSLVFTVEYILRIISAPCLYPYKTGFKARLKYIFSFFGIIDLSATLPFILLLFFINTQTANLINLSHIFIIFKLVRYTSSFKMMGDVVHSVYKELLTTLMTACIVICFAAILMYYLEREAQPEKFTDIGEGLWWAFATFATVGYGDIYPVTGMGKILGAFISLLGISMIAIITGLISSAFMHKLRENKEGTGASGNCPACGKPLNDTHTTKKEHDIK